MIKNVVHPGWVISQNDGDRHYITGAMLIKLYGLNPAETTICREKLASHDNYTHYYPRYDGKYIKE